MDGLLGLVPVLPQQHKADLLLQLRRNEAIGDLPIHNIVCNTKSVAPLTFQHSERFKAVLGPLSSIRCTASGGLTHDLWQGVTLQVQQNAPCLQTGPELKQAVEGQRGDVRLAPSFSSLLHFLLELHPPMN